MLVLKRMVGEKVVIDGGIELTVLSAGKQYVRLGISAPEDIVVHRKEVHDNLKALEDAGEATERRPCIS